MIRPLLLLTLAAAGCAEIPRDPGGTLDRVKAERQFKVGLIAAGPKRVGSDREAEFIARVAAATGARPSIEEGSAEPLLLALEAGDLDLVIGSLVPKSPWVSEVAVLKPLGEPAVGDRGMVVPIARSGENAWIMLLEREVRIVRAGKGE